MRVLLAALLVAWSYSARASDPWTTGDTVREAAFAAIVAVDMRTTHDLLARGSIELNPVLGRHPGDLRLAATASAEIAAHAAVAWMLPRRWRTVWQYASIGIESLNVGRQFYITLRVGPGGLRGVSRTPP